MQRGTSHYHSQGAIVAASHLSQMRPHLLKRVRAEGLASLSEAQSDG